MRLYLARLHDDARGDYRIHGQGAAAYLDVSDLEDLDRQIHGLRAQARRPNATKAGTGTVIVVLVLLLLLAVVAAPVLKLVAALYRWALS